MDDVLGLLGLCVLLLRLWPRPAKVSFRNEGASVIQSESGVSGLNDLQVSIVIPARNEERNIGRLLESLQSSGLPFGSEVIVVDDQSTDHTAAVAASHGVKVIAAGERPEGWVGKSWACAQGAAQARGAFLLFTDADTIHRHGALRRALRFMGKRSLDLCSAPPFHQTPTLWEKCLGPFQLLTLLATNLYGRPHRERLFSIGQFLLFRREFYERMGGHAAVKSCLAEDLEFARLCLARGGGYGVYTGLPLYEVRMYGTFAEFIRGWLRNLRLGMKGSHWSVFPEMILVFSVLTGSGKFFSGIGASALLVAALVAVGFFQRQHGAFSWMGLVLFPLSLFLFTAISLAALVSEITGRDLVWKSRRYRPQRAS